MNLIVCFATCLVIAVEVCGAGLIQWKPFHRSLVDYGVVRNPLEVSVELKQNSTVRAVFTYKSRWLSCDGDLSLNYTLTIYSDDRDMIKEETVPFLTCDSSFRLAIDYLQRNKAYNAFLTVKSDDGSYSFKSKEVYFTTTEVQSAYIIRGNHHLQIICLLSTGSTAKGCEVSLELKDSRSSVGIETQLFDVYRTGTKVAQSCVRLSRTLTVSDVEVYDWTEDEEMGAIEVPSTIINSDYAPCYVDSASSKEWKETSHLILFIVSAAFMILGTLTIFVGLFCRLCRLHRHFKRDSHKALQGDSIKCGYSRPYTNI